MGLQNFNITSGEEYANILIEQIWISHKKHEGTEAEAEVLMYWCREIKAACIKRYADYIAGDEVDYKLSEEEMAELYRRAIEKMTGEILEKLLDNGDVVMGVSEEGEIVYSSTEQGRKRVRNVKKKK